MTTQKLIKYDSFAINGEKLSAQTKELNLKVLGKIW